MPAQRRCSKLLRNLSRASRWACPGELGSNLLDFGDGDHDVPAQPEGERLHLLHGEEFGAFGEQTARAGAHRLRVEGAPVPLFAGRRTGGEKGPCLDARNAAYGISSDVQICAPDVPGRVACCSPS